MATFSGIGSAFGSFFGASDLEERFNQAIEVLKQFQQTAETSLQGFREKGQLSFDQALRQLTNPEMAPDVRALRTFLTTEIASGLSPFAKLQFEDLNKQLESRAITTGNLRSGAIGIQRAELGRRIAADEFTRALNVLDTAQKFDAGTAATFLQGAVNFAGAENMALGTVGRTVENVAGALTGLGAVEQQASTALGAGIGGLADYGVSSIKSFGGGSFTGGLNKLIPILGG